MTDSVKTVGQEAKQPVTELAEVLQLSMADQIRLAEAILNPPEPTELLKQAFEHHKRLIGYG